MPSTGDEIVDKSVALYILAAVGLSALTTLFTSAVTSIPATVLGLVTTLVAILFSLGVALAFYRRRGAGK